MMMMMTRLLLLLLTDLATQQTATVGRRRAAVDREMLGMLWMMVAAGTRLDLTCRPHTHTQLVVHYRRRGFVY